MLQSFDIAVIGGGIAGVGVAREAARRGYSVALIEKSQCLAATSANSLRIIHGGFRYLQTMHLPRIVESIRAQAKLLDNYPDYIRPLKCLMPLTKFGLKSRIPAQVAASIYRVMYKSLAGRRVEAGVLTAEVAQACMPLLKGRVAYGALTWQDAHIVDLPGFHKGLLSELQRLKVTVLNNSIVTSIHQNSNQIELGLNSPETEHCQAKVAINCAGPWLNTITKDKQLPIPKYWCRAFNVVLNRQLTEEYAIGLQSPEGRLYFIVPRGDHSAVGTGYLPLDGDIDNAVLHENELQAFISGLRAVLPEANVSINDVSRVELGVQPAKSQSDGLPALYGAKHISHNGRLIELLSTKYTTFEAQAEEIISAAQIVIKLL